MGTSFVTDATGLRVQPLEICLAHLSAFLMTDLGYPWVEKNSDILLHYRRKSSSSEQSSQTEVLRVWNAYFCDRVMRRVEIQVGVGISKFVENRCSELAMFDVD